jgi:hypothetical protein
MANQRALSGLYLLMGDNDRTICVGSLSRPGTLVAQAGWSPEAYGDAEFQTIAAETQAAVRVNSGKLHAADIERARRSLAALLLGRPLAEVMLTGVDKSTSGDDVPDERGEAVWAAMGEVVTTATIR